MFTVLFSVVCAWFAFFLPCLSTYKALSIRPLPEKELERLCMYWTVIGAFVAAEYLAEWLVSWLPFYWEIKTAFLLFLSLPQTQGSTYVYQSFLQPFFARNEASIDSGIIAIQASILSFAKAQLNSLWELLWSTLNKSATSAQPVAPASPSAGTSTPQPGQPQPVPSPFEAALGLWRTYGPAFMSTLQPVMKAQSPQSVKAEEPRAATPNEAST